LLQQTADITYWIAFTAGILSFASPCVLPLIPSYLTYITGLSFSQLDDEHPDAKVRLTVLLHTLCFILGFSAVFILLGALPVSLPIASRPTCARDWVGLKRSAGY